eukprot:CFRG1953T1
MDHKSCGTEVIAVKTEGHISSPGVSTSPSPARCNSASINSPGTHDRDMHEDARDLMSFWEKQQECQHVQDMADRRADYQARSSNTPAAVIVQRENEALRYVGGSPLRKYPYNAVPVPVNIHSKSSPSSPFEGEGGYRGSTRVGASSGGRYTPSQTYEGELGSMARRNISREDIPSGSNQYPSGDGNEAPVFPRSPATGGVNDSLMVRNLGDRYKMSPSPPPLPRVVSASPASSLGSAVVRAGELFARPDVPTHHTLPHVSQLKEILGPDKEQSTIRNSREGDVEGKVIWNNSVYAQTDASSPARSYVLPTKGTTAPSYPPPRSVTQAQTSQSNPPIIEQGQAAAFLMALMGSESREFSNTPLTPTALKSPKVRSTKKKAVIGKASSPPKTALGGLSRLLNPNYNIMWPDSGSVFEDLIVVEDTPVTIAAAKVKKPAPKSPKRTKSPRMEKDDGKPTITVHPSSGGSSPVIKKTTSKKRSSPQKKITSPNTSPRLMANKSPRQRQRSPPKAKRSFLHRGETTSVTNFETLESVTSVSQRKKRKSVCVDMHEDTKEQPKTNHQQLKESSLYIGCPIDAIDSSDRTWHAARIRFIEDLDRVGRGKLLDEVVVDPQVSTSNITTTTSTATDKDLAIDPDIDMPVAASLITKQESPNDMLSFSSTATLTHNLESTVVPTVIRTQANIPTTSLKTAALSTSNPILESASTITTNTPTTNSYLKIWVLVHFEGWGTEYNEWVRVEQLRERTDDALYGPTGPDSDPKWDAIRIAGMKRDALPESTGIVYDTDTLAHACTCAHPDEAHPERPDRIASILKQFDEEKLFERVVPVRGREATLNELSAVHVQDHINNYGGVKVGGHGKNPPNVEKMPCGGSGIATDTVFNLEDTSQAARLSAGCLLELTRATIAGKLRNGFAVIRPPGHHAEIDAAGGFCFFNNVGVAIRAARKEFKVGRVMVVDWDVHHGNGTQDVFKDDPDVLYLSLHRYDHGDFYPGTGAVEEVGEGDGEGLSVNIAWNNCDENPPGNTEYMAAFLYIVIPIAREFAPDVIIVSAGFDAADGDLIGGCKVAPTGFAHMTQLLMDVMDGRVLLSLEGGYRLTALSDSATGCMKVLMGEKPPLMSVSASRSYSLSLNTKPNIPLSNAIKSFDAVVNIHRKYWKCMQQLWETIYGDHVAAGIGGCRADDTDADGVVSDGSVQSEDDLQSNPQQNDSYMVTRSGFSLSRTASLSNSNGNGNENGNENILLFNKNSAETLSIALSPTITRSRSTSPKLSAQNVLPKVEINGYSPPAMTTNEVNSALSETLVSNIRKRMYATSAIKGQTDSEDDTMSIKSEVSEKRSGGNGGWTGFINTNNNNDNISGRRLIKSGRRRKFRYEVPLELFEPRDLSVRRTSPRGSAASPVKRDRKSTRSVEKK